MAEKQIKRSKYTKSKGKSINTSHAESIDNKSPCWRFSRVNCHDKWCFQKNEEYILTKLCDFETMTWGDIKGKNSHFISDNIDCLIKEAQDEIIKKQIDADRFFSLRLQGRERIYGVLDKAGILNIIWYDPNHEIYPVSKKNT